MDTDGVYEGCRRYGPVEKLSHAGSNHGDANNIFSAINSPANGILLPFFKVQALSVGVESEY
jgi:hypothetical protein